MKSLKTPDMVNAPPHYIAPNGLEAVHVIESFGLGFHLGCALKYILRAGRKNDAVQDLDKAIWFLRRRRDQLAAERDQSATSPALATLTAAAQNVKEASRD